MTIGIRSALFSRKTPGGVFTIEGIYETPGDVYFCDSAHANAEDSAGSGLSPDKPFATIEYGAGLMTASNGSVMYVMPNHAETVSSAGALTLDVIGITIIGLGTPSQRPTITLDTADTADILINAAGITIRNVEFIANFVDITAAIDVDAVDFTLDGCAFTDTSASLNAKIWIQDGATTTSSRITVKNCTSNCKGTNNTHFINLAGTGDGHVITGNRLMGTWATNCLGGAGLVTYCTITDNEIFNADTTADVCIVMGATATGIVARNMCTGGHAAQGIIPGDLGSLENYYEGNTTDTSGSLEPAVT